MIKRTQIGSTFVSIEELKRYLGFDGDDRDSELDSTIETATQIIEDQNDIALRTMTIELSTQSDEHGVVRLYHPDVESIESVESTTGEPIAFTQQLRCQKLRIKANTACVITYNVLPRIDCGAFKHSVLSLSAKLFTNEN